MALLFSCQTSETKLSSKEDKRSEPTKKEISKSKKELILQAQNIEYYELPDIVDISDPETLLTFSIPVKNKEEIAVLRRLVVSSESPSYETPPENCRPRFHSALVFRHIGKTETLLFSINCGLIYLYQEKVYLDVGMQRMEIEKSFRKIRSGR